MKLEPWLKASTGRTVALAAFLGVSKSMVSQMARGKVPVPTRLYRPIREYTKGEVDYEDLLPDDRSPAPRAQPLLNPVTLPAETPPPAVSIGPGTPVTGGNRAGDPTGRAPERQAQDKSRLKWPECGERREHPPEVPGSGAVTRRKNPDLRAAEKAL